MYACMRTSMNRQQVVLSPGKPAAARARGSPAQARHCVAAAGALRLQYPLRPAGSHPHAQLQLRRLLPAAPAAAGIRGLTCVLRHRVGLPAVNSIKSFTSDRWIAIQQQACPVAQLHLSLPHVISCACIPRRGDVNGAQGHRETIWLPLISAYMLCAACEGQWHGSLHLLTVHVHCAHHRGRMALEATKVAGVRMIAPEPCECHPECFGAEQCTSRQTAECDAKMGFAL
jgi:hypothetical protein